MNSMLDSLLVVVLIINIAILGSGRMRTVIRLAAAQGVLLGVLAFAVREQPDWMAAVASLAAMGLKGVVIPVMLMRALRSVHIKREVEPLIGLLPSMLIGAAATAFSLVFAAQLPLVPGYATQLLVPSALATMLCGFFVLVSRIKTITQVIGYLILENGIFIFGMLLSNAMPLLVELGVLLDLFVGIFVICIIVNHINRTFSTLDTRQLAELKE